MKRKVLPAVRTYLVPSAVTVLLSFLFLNLAFLLDYLYQSAVRFMWLTLSRTELRMDTLTAPYLLHVSYLFVLALITMLVSRSPMPRIVKAAWLTVPVAAVYITIGIVSYPNATLSYIAGALSGMGMIIVIRRISRHWLYTFAWTAASVMILISALTGTEI